MYTNDAKVLPQAPEIEESVLGALMIDSSAFSKINLKSDDFYSVKNQKIYNAIQKLASKFSPIDMHTVTEQLRKNGDLEDVGGPYTIAMLTAKVASAAHISFHAQIIAQKSVARRLISITSNIQELSYDEQSDVSDIIEQFEKHMTDLSVGSTKCEAYDMDDSLSETINYMQKVQRDAESGISTSISTGLPELDRLINGGWNEPDLIVVGARPSMGKTQFAVKFAEEAAKASRSVGFVSIEMTKIQLILRLLTQNDSIDYYKIKTGQLSTEEWRLIDEAISEISKLAINIADDSNVRDLSNIKSLARSLKRQGKLDLLIIDYLQLIKTNMKFGTRDLEIGYITGELKNLAKELHIPIILLSQLNRPLKGVKVTAPKLEDLRESGNIEQDADIVLLLHRPSYYDSDAIDKFGNPWKNRGYIVMGKSREGNRDERVYFYHNDTFKKIWGDDANRFNDTAPY